MTFILVPHQGDDVQVNGWNWQPTLQLLRYAGLLTGEAYERMTAQGCGGQVDSELAARFADAVDRTLAEMNPGERMLTDLSVTARPKAYELNDPTIYSATYDWLRSFSEFCRRSGGFEVR